MNISYENRSFPPVFLPSPLSQFIAIIYTTLLASNFRDLILVSPRQEQTERAKEKR